MTGRNTNHYITADLHGGEEQHCVCFLTISLATFSVLGRRHSHLTMGAISPLCTHMLLFMAKLGKPHTEELKLSPLNPQCGLARKPCLRTVHQECFKSNSICFKAESNVGKLRQLERDWKTSSAGHTNNRMPQSCCIRALVQPHAGLEPTSQLIKTLHRANIDHTRRRAWVVAATRQRPNQ